MSLELIVLLRTLVRDKSVDHPYSLTSYAKIYELCGFFSAYAEVTFFHRFEDTSLYKPVDDDSDIVETFLYLRELDDEVYRDIALGSIGYL